jgi:hypothetical protein
MIIARQIKQALMPDQKFILRDFTNENLKRKRAI